jgi:hypothetical protein
MHLKTITGRSFLMAAMLALPLASLAAVAPADLMRNLETAANNAADHASELESAAFATNVSWEVHAQKLQALKDDVNEIGRIVTRLDELRGSLTTAGQDSLGRVVSLAREMAASAQSAIQFLNVDQQNFWSPSYRKNLAIIETDSSQLARIAEHAR